MTLETGKIYSITEFAFTGWTAGDGSSTEGYAVEYYFDAQGRYLGPDEHGIEPEFEPA